MRQLFTKLVNPVRWLIGLGLLLALNSCLFSAYERVQPHSPTSRQPSVYSLATNLPLRLDDAAALFTFPAYDGYPDHRVLAVRRLREDTANYAINAPLTAAQRPRPADSASLHLTTLGNMPTELHQRYYRGIVQHPFVTPGTVWLYYNDLLVDEIELPNIEWQHFINYVARDSGAAVATRYVPLPANLPLPTYFTDPFYRYYPVTGISREQAEAYCCWRSRVTTAALAAAEQLAATHPDYMVMRYRLPTEAEWEYAAERGVASDETYGINQPVNQVRIKPKAAEYLRRRAHATPAAAQVRDDIRAFNKAAAKSIQFNCQRPAPYFLALPTPGYVFDLPQNFYGLYHVAGNVAELVQEPGLTKGGSYLDPLEACAIKARGRYVGPAPSVGFRCVCELSFPNQKR